MNLFRFHAVVFGPGKRFFGSSKEIFENAVKSISLLKEEPSNEVKLTMYALFKQAKDGPCNTPSPSLFDPVGRAKHSAWSKLKGMSSEEAMKTYVEEVSKLHGGTIPAASAPVASSAANASATDQPFYPPFVPFPKRGGISMNGRKLKTINLAVDEKGVGRVTLNRPSTLNAFNMQMWHDLREAFSIADVDAKARVVILTGSEKSFTTGMDLSVFADLQKTVEQESCPGRQRESLIHTIKFLQDCISAPERCAIPVIAAISGHCIGGGVDLATACDLRYCTADASFCIKETDLAMVADIGTLQRLPKLIGDQQARELAYTARVFKGPEAEKLGLVVKCFSTHAEMMSHVEATASAIASKSPITTRGVKKTLLYARDHSVKDSLHQIQLWNGAHFMSNDLMEAFRATMSKEAPNYKQN